MSIHLHRAAHEGTVENEAALVQFQDGWSTYQKVLDNNVLSHRQVADILHRTMMEVSGPVDFLDIACGDGSQMRGALANTTVRHYRGIDLSEPALRLAAKNLAGMPFDVDLHHCDFATALTARAHRSDVSWCGLSIHHLSREGKLALFRALCETTGKFLMIHEPVLREGESLSRYFDRYERVCKPAWTFLEPEEWDEVFHHISTCDLPENPRTWMELGREAGFARARQLYIDKHELYALYRFDR